MEVEEFGALAVFGGFFRGGEVALGEGDAAFLSDGADGFGEAEVLDFLDEVEDVSMLVADVYKRQVSRSPTSTTSLRKVRRAASSP